MRRNIDDILREWSFDAKPGEIQARKLRTQKGRSVIQIRVELGLLQLEVDGRPDGHRPHGFDTYLEYLKHLRASAVVDEKSDPWTLELDHCEEVDREFVQYYHRRVALLALRDYEQACRDASHTLSLMDFITANCQDADYVSSHERLRGLVLFHRTQAQAAVLLEQHRYEEAVDSVRQGIEELRVHQGYWSEEFDGNDQAEQPLIDQLEHLEAELRSSFSVSKTLREQLDEAIASEDYEHAAILRDQIRRQDGWSSSSELR